MKTFITLPNKLYDICWKAVGQTESFTKTEVQKIFLLKDRKA